MYNANAGYVGSRIECTAACSRCVFYKGKTLEYGDNKENDNS